jgi:hypothetical protein
MNDELCGGGCVLGKGQESTSGNTDGDFETKEIAIAKWNLRV